MPDVVLEIVGLSYAYPDGNEAIRAVDLKIERGSRTFFHGANGAGKTTLFQCVNGLLKPRSGEIRIDGVSVRKETERMRRIGIVFQNAADQIVSGSVFDEIAFGPLNRGVPRDRISERVERAATLLGVGHLLDRPPHFLSYGEKKRVCIASVLSMEQDIVILDEPTAGLDARLVVELADILDRLAAEGRTLLVATHDADFSLRCADRVVVLDRGAAICEGNVEDVFSRRDILDKAGLVKPVLMEVLEKLSGFSRIAKGTVPKTLEELTQMLERNAT